VNYRPQYPMANYFYCLSELVAFDLPVDTFILGWIANEENQ
jgi:hypothetical protein